VEIYGLILGTGAASVVGAALAILVFFRRSLRRFALALFATPALSFPALILIRWTVLDNAPICGPDPEWDHCPSNLANAEGWIAWIVCAIAIAFGSYWAQRVIVTAVGLWMDSKPRSVFASEK
jgi:energy-coupling factor transporter transmembrane protein EcfT